MNRAWVRWVIAVTGFAVFAVGARGLWVHRIDTRPGLGARELVSFWLGGALLNDLLVAPACIVVALAVRRVVPAWARSWVLGALLVSATTTLVAWPALRGYGERADNASVLPRDEVRGLVLVLAAVWLVALCGCVADRVRRRGAGVEAAPPT